MQTPFSDAEFGKNRACLSRQLAATANCRFQLGRHGQLFIGAHNETLSVALRVNDKDVSPSLSASCLPCRCRILDAFHAVNGARTRLGLLADSRLRLTVPR